MASVVDSYIESVKMLPPELRKNFKLMRELDAQSQDLQRRLEEALTVRAAELKDCAEGGVSNGGHAPPQKEAHGKERQIEKDHETCAQIAERKVAIAEQTYNLVDKHIRRLDTDLHRLQAEVKAERASAAATKPPPQEQPSSTPPESNGDAQEHSPGGTERKRGLTSPDAPIAVAEAPLPPPVEIDLPVDPNEPTYCYCQQVSFGEMVGCDNKDCPITWFHFECVGLTTKPRGKWYCPDCIHKVKKKRTK